MSANEKISRLQGLLERVQTRAAEPRSGAAQHAPTNGHAAMAAAAAPAPAVVPYVSPLQPDLEMMPSQPPPANTISSAPPPNTVEYDVDSDADVEVSTETVDIDIDVDEPEPMPLESGAQPVAQQTMPPGDLEEEEELEPLVAHAAPAAELEEVVEAPPPPPPANEIEEPTPSSSRRPIAGEEPAAEAYEAESAPRHTPPPESGKQVAAAPSAHPPSWRPSAPPPSLEGHTLIGGWREPGLGGPQIGPAAMGSPVRVPGPGTGASVAKGPTGTEPPATMQHVPPVAAQPSGTRLSPDVTRAELPPAANVASFQGTVEVAKPKTLGELLDLTLAL